MMGREGEGRVFLGVSDGGVVEKKALEEDKKIHTQPQPLSHSGHAQKKLSLILSMPPTPNSSQARSTTAKSAVAFHTPPGATDTGSTAAAFSTQAKRS